MRKTKKRKFSIATSVIGSEATLALSGPLNAAASAVLGPECATLLEANYAITLDLANVPFADRAGLELVTALWEFGATLTHAPTDIAQKIESNRGVPRWL